MTFELTRDRSQSFGGRHLATVTIHGHFVWGEWVEAFDSDHTVWGYFAHALELALGGDEQ